MGFGLSTRQNPQGAFTKLPQREVRHGARAPRRRASPEWRGWAVALRAAAPLATLPPAWRAGSAIRLRQSLTLRAPFREWVARPCRFRAVAAKHQPRNGDKPCR